MSRLKYSPLKTANLVGLTVVSATTIGTIDCLSYVVVFMNVPAIIGIYQVWRYDKQTNIRLERNTWNTIQSSTFVTLTTVSKTRTIATVDCMSYVVVFVKGPAIVGIYEVKKTM